MIPSRLKVLSLAVAFGLSAATVPAVSAAPFGNLFSASQPALYQAEQQAPWLIDHLPSSTETYVRIPPAWSLLQLDGDQEPEALAKAMADLRPALLKLILQDIPAEIQPLISGLLDDVDGPIEYAMYGVATGNPPAYFSAGLKTRDPAVVDAMMQAITSENYALDVEIQTPGVGALVKYEKPQIFYRFDAQTGRLTLMANATKASEADWSWIKETTTDTLKTSIANASSDAKGMIFWQKNIPMVTMMARHEVPVISAFGLDQLRSLSLVSQRVEDGHYQAKVSLEIPQSGLRQLFPTVSSPITLKTLGTPEWAFFYTMPDAKAIEDVISQVMYHAEAGISYSDVKARLQSEYKVDLDLLINGFAGRWLAVSDDYGTLTATDAAHLADFDATIAMLKTAGFVGVDEALDHGIRHIELSNTMLLGTEFEEEELADLPNIVQQFFKLPSHIYLLSEGDYLLLSDIPQPLIARTQQAADQDLGQWLAQAGIASEHSSWGFATDVDNLSLKHYYTLVKYVSLLNDLTGSEINIMDLPTANELNLPRTGLVSMTINNSNDNLSLTMNSPHDISDWLYAGNTTVMLVGVGILGGAIIPAYMDYQMRTHYDDLYQDDSYATVEATTEAATDAETAEAVLNIDESRLRGDLVIGLAELEPLQQAMDTWQSEGNLFYDFPQEELDAAIADSALWDEIEADDDTIWVRFGNELENGAGGKWFGIYPEADDAGKITWYCWADDYDLDKYMPESCFKAEGE